MNGHHVLYSGDASNFEDTFLWALSNILLGCLAFSNLFVGVLSQPCFVPYKIAAINKDFETHCLSTFICHGSYRSSRGNPDSEIREIFASGIRNPALGIRNPANDWNPESKLPKSTPNITGTSILLRFAYERLCYKDLSYKGF